MPATHSYHDIVMTKKAHQADLRKRQEDLDDCRAEVRAERFMQEEALERASKSQEALEQALKSSRKGKKKMGSARSVEIMMKALEEKLMNQLNDSRTQQDETIKHLDDKIKYQDETIKHQDETITHLDDKIQGLEVSLEHYSAVVRVLHRRVVLDDARSLLSTRYGFPPTSLRPGYREADGQPTKSLGQLVKEVRLKLNQDDARLLPDEALKMIFDSTGGTVRGEVNKVAHRASAEDLALAITGDDLTALQAKTLQDIYEFVHHEIPLYKRSDCL
ncbi:uncharacterized protein HD556DRAFT_624820 [Suillus plorans]|uniref:Uncharacterized protein n=1 Tax=Suillus plorans TaxID=116603 RepID=A0A9P7AN34_9AGAM|nr:uncharacterized protein HD556DRAFT_624820 [Suillus plorans]KAG1791855.1 hypothetical protein HD556DRAFT_624820 [Suillus plorans]